MSLINELKVALLTRFGVTSLQFPPGKNPIKTYHHLKGQNWIWPKQWTNEAISESIILEPGATHFLSVDVMIWVKECKAVDGVAAAKVMLQYVKAWKLGPLPHYTSAAH